MTELFNLETKQRRMSAVAALRRLSTALLVILTAIAQPAQAQHTAASESSVASQNIGAVDLAPYPEVRSHIEQGQLASALALLDRTQAAHDNDPAYFNLMGILALKVAEYATAVSAFERVVLMQPDNAGAWLDLAISSAESGNVSSAEAYFDYVETQFSPPPSVRALIARYRARLADRAHISPWQVQVEAMFGVDSNANSGLQSSAIPLTLGADRIDLVVDPSFRARSDKFLQAGVSARYLHPFGSDTLEIVTGVRSRDYAHENKFSTISANLSAGLHRPTAIGDASAWLHVENLWLGGSQLLHSARAVAQVERPYERCRLGFSLEGEWRRYANLSSLDADIFWAQAGVACDWSVARIPVQAILVGRTGFDNPTNVRPGGQTRHHEVVTQIGMPVAWGARAELSMAFAEAIDKEGYSPLLEQNAARHLDRRNIRLLLAIPVSAAADFQVLAEDTRFKSNLTLFQQTGKSLSMGFRYRF